jgi:hypothetical protein
MAGMGVAKPVFDSYNVTMQLEPTRDACTSRCVII